MKTFAKGAIVAAMLAATAATPLLAQAGPVLTLDMERLYSDSAAAKGAQTAMLARYDATQKQINANLESSGQALQAQETAIRTALGGTQDVSKVPAATQQAYAAAQQRYAAARQDAAQFTQAVQASQGYARDQIIEAVLPIAEAVRAERRASLVVPRGNVLATDPAGDITNVVLPRLDAALKTVQIVPPQPAAAPAAAGAAPAPARPGATPPATTRRPQPQGR